MRFLSRPEELVLLAVWRLKDQAYSVPIRRQVSDISGKEWSFGAIYVPLHRLEEKGLVRSCLSESVKRRGGRSKRIYELTKDGKAALEEVRQLHASMWAGVPGFSLD